MPCRHYFVEPADTHVETNSGNESTFMEGDTDITEPDVTTQEAIADKVTSDFGTALLATNKVNSVQPYDASSTKLKAVTVNAAQVEHSLQETLVGDESEGKNHHN
jgi:hypothetical protein